MHGAGVVGEEKATLAQFRDELFDRRLADSIGAIVAEFLRDGFSDGRIFCRSEKNPVHRRFCGNRRRGFGETFRQPAFGRAVFGAGTQADLHRIVCWRDDRCVVPEIWDDTEVVPPHIRSHSLRDAKIADRLMFDWSRFFAFRNDLIQQPAAPVSAKTDAPRNTREPRFQS